MGKITPMKYPQMIRLCPKSINFFSIYPCLSYRGYRHKQTDRYTSTWKWSKWIQRHPKRTDPKKTRGRTENMIPIIFLLDTRKCHLWIRSEVCLKRVLHWQLYTHWHLSGSPHWQSWATSTICTLYNGGIV